MRKMVSVLIAATVATGCYAGVHGGVRVRGPNLFPVLATAVAVNAIVNTVAYAPPPAANVEFYAYGHNPGHVWVNGRYTYVNDRWAWQRGYWQADRPGNYWVQGAWTPRGNQHVWVEGHWTGPRAGYVYTSGYWENSGNGYQWRAGQWQAERAGHVYVDGSWTTYNGRRTWRRGGWQRDDGRAEWNHYRSRGRVRGSTRGTVRGGATIRDHRR